MAKIITIDVKEIPNQLTLHNGNMSVGIKNCPKNVAKEIFKFVNSFNPSSVYANYFNNYSITASSKLTNDDKKAIKSFCDSF